MRTRHSSIQRTLQTFIVTVKIEPDTDDERRLLINAFDQEAGSRDALVHQYIDYYVSQNFPGMKVTRADHDKYPTLLKVYLERQSQN